MTLKQTAAIELITSKKADTVGKAMRQAGYAKVTSLTPKRLTNSKAWKQKLGALAKAHNVTIEQYMMNLGMGMTAMKQNQYTGEVTEDIGTRLSANKQAERFIFKGSDGKDKQDMTADELKELADASDEVAVNLLFKKG